MIFGLKINQQSELVNGLVDEWNEIFSEPTRSIISETRYYKSTDTLKLANNTYIMSIKPIFPLFLWFTILGLGAIASAIFSKWSLVAILLSILIFMSLFFMPILYYLGTKHRLKKNGYTGKLKYVKPSEILRQVIDLSEVKE